MKQRAVSEGTLFNTTTAASVSAVDPLPCAVAVAGLCYRPLRPRPYEKVLPFVKCMVM
jgi:hypothetical protein